MMKTLDPSIQQAQVLSILQSTARSSTDPRVPRGVVDALAALQAISPNVPPTLVVNSPLEGANVSPKGVRFEATVTDPDTKLPPAILVAWFDTDGRVLCIGRVCDSGALSLGDHTIRVAAADEVGGLTETEVHIHVVNTAPTPVISLPVNGSTFFVGQLIGFRGTATDPDEDASGLLLSWSSSRDGALGTGGEISRTLSQGDHVITLQATDQFGASAATSISITVNPPGGGGLPSAQIFAPADDSTFTPGTLIRFTGSGFDPDDGELLDGSLSWSSSIDGFLGTGRQLDAILSPPSQLCNPESRAVHIITLTVTDSAGNQTTFSIVVKIGVIC